MTKTEAAEFLSLSETATADDVRSRFQELYSDYHIRLTNAPTATLKRVYQRNLEELRLACETFFPGMVFATPQDFPAAEPVHGIPDIPIPRSSPSMQSGAADPGSSKTDRIGSSRHFNLAIVGASIVGAVAILFAVLWYRAIQERNGLNAFLAADSDEQIAYLRQRPKLAPQLLRTLSLLKNGKFSVCNDSTASIEIDWVIATYRGDDGVLRTFNSRNYPTMDSDGAPKWAKWHIIGNGGSQNLNLTKGSELVWDGSVVSYAIGVNYDGQEYVRGGAWSTVQDGCMHIRY